MTNNQNLNSTDKKTRTGKSTSKIYYQLRKEILQNQISPSQSIKQENIAEQFGVSKIPVREALRLLEADGLVEFKPRRGAFVVELSEQEILENLDIRIALECRAIELAVPKMTNNDFVKARAILEKYQKVKKESVWSELNSDFHNCIYAPCGLTKLLDLIQSIKDRTSLFMRLKITNITGLERPHAEHLAILEACELGDEQRSALLVREHIESTKKEVMAYFRHKK